MKKSTKKSTKKSAKKLTKKSNEESAKESTKKRTKKKKQKKTEGSRTNKKAHLFTTGPARTVSLKVVVMRIFSSTWWNKTDPTEKKNIKKKRARERHLL